MIRLEKLHIRKLGNIAPNTELAFGPRGALLLGKNGTGKTALLNLIVVALRVDWNELTRRDSEGFNIEYVLQIVPPTQSSIRIHVQVIGAAQQERDATWLYIDGPPPFDHFFKLSVTDDKGVSLVEIESQQEGTNYRFANRPAISHPRAAHDIPSALNLQSSKEPVFEGAHEISAYLSSILALLHRHDEALHYFENLTDGDDRYPNELVQFQYEGEEPSTADYRSRLISDETCKALQSAFISVPDAPVYPRLEVTRNSSPSVISLSWLQEFCNICNLDKVAISFPLLESKSSRDKTVVTYGAMDIRYWTHRSILRSHHLSFGQKRLFSLLHYFDAHKAIVLADELVNGLHHEWIDRCIDFTETRQSFLSSQNPLLFDFMSFSSVEDAAERFIECSVDDQGRFVWKNMSLASATEFYEVYQVGTQHVSEILQTRGYW